MSALSIVPARSGSKRLPGKNMMKLGGRTLLQRACESAPFACVVSSDSREYLAHAADFGVEGLLRPAELATDEATTGDVVLHVIEHFYTYETLILLQPTSPLRTKRDVQEALELFYDAKADSLISVNRGDTEPNGAIYIVSRDWFRKHKTFVDPQTLRFEMPPERGIDIDTIEDFERAEDYLLGPRVLYADGHVGRSKPVEKPPFWDSA